MTIGLRVSPENERLGADAVMHGLVDTDDCSTARPYHARRKSYAAHHEKTLWEDAAERCGSLSATGSTPLPKTMSFGRASFLRRTFSHVMRRGKTTPRCGTLPSYWSPRLYSETDSWSIGNPRQDPSFASQMTEIEQCSTLVSNGLPSTPDVTLYV